MTPKEVLDHVSGIGYACDQACTSGCGCMAEGLKMILDLIAGEREALLVEIESTFPTQEKENPDDDKKFPLCDEYNCDGRLHKLIAKLREPRQR